MWLRPGPEWLLHAERRLPLPTGLPEAPRHAVQQLQRVCRGGGGHSPGKNLPSRLLCVHRLQVGAQLCFQKVFLMTAVSTYEPASLRQAFPAGECVTFSGRNCLCQRCVRPPSPTPSGLGCPSRELRNILTFNLMLESKSIYSLKLDNRSNRSRTLIWGKSIISWRIYAMNIGQLSFLCQPLFNLP